MNSQKIEDFNKLVIIFCVILFIELDSSKSGQKNWYKYFLISICKKEEIEEKISCFITFFYDYDTV